MKQHPAANGTHQTLNAESDRNLAFHELPASDKRYDLENRLLEFASAVIDLSEMLPASRAGNHVAGQIPRSGTSPYPNHGEAESAESREDFIHKLKICLKELRETRRWARLIQRKNWVNADGTVAHVLREAEELIRVFFASIQTAKRNALRERRRSSVSPEHADGPNG